MWNHQICDKDTHRVKAPGWRSEVTSKEYNLISTEVLQALVYLIQVKSH